jgi:hypothetical protein
MKRDEFDSGIYTVHILHSPYPQPVLAKQAIDSGIFYPSSLFAVDYPHFLSAFCGDNHSPSFVIFVSRHDDVAFQSISTIAGF